MWICYRCNQSIEVARPVCDRMPLSVSPSRTLGKPSLRRCSTGPHQHTPLGFILLSSLTHIHSSSFCLPPLNGRLVGDIRKYYHQRPLVCPRRSALPHPPHWCFCDARIINNRVQARCIVSYKRARLLDVGTTVSRVISETRLMGSPSSASRASQDASCPFLLVRRSTSSCLQTHAPLSLHSRAQRSSPRSPIQ